jgi:Tfp pilus assembly protein PilF
MTGPKAALLLALIAAALYGPRLAHPFVTDDAIYIVENPAVHRGVPLPAYFLDRSTVASDPDYQWQSYRPLRTLAFRAVAVVAGVRPLPYAVVNLALYLAAALLVLVLGRRLALAPGPALAATALWVAAPVHVEPVLYASALGDHLSLVLELAGLIVALGTLHAERLRPAAALGAVGLVLAAMLAKEMAVTAPALLALLAWSTGALRSRRRRTIATVAAHGSAALLFLAARTAVLGAFGHGPLTTGAALAGAAAVPVRLGAYLHIVLAPLGHHPGYVLPATPVAWQLVAWAVLLGAAVALRPAPVQVRLGLVWFVVALTPVLGLVPLLADLADRFALLPSVGLCWAGAAAAPMLARRWRPLGQVATAVLLALYAAGTITEQVAWADEARLWGKAAALEPRSAQAHRNLGVVLLQRGQPALALEHFQRAQALGDGGADLLRRQAVALEALGAWPEAEGRAAAALARTSATDARAGQLHALLGSLRARRGALARAREDLVRARELGPDNASTLLLEAQIARTGGDLRAALAAETRLAARYPHEPRFRYQRGLTLLLSGDPAAVTEARECLRFSPEQPQCLCLLGRALVAQGRDDAETHRALEAGGAALPAGEDRDACQESRRRLR